MIKDFKILAKLGREAISKH